MGRGEQFGVLHQPAQVLVDHEPDAGAVCILHFFVVQVQPALELGRLWANFANVLGE